MPQGSADGNFLIVTSGANITTLQAHYGHHNAVLRFHCLITKPQGADHLSTPNFVVLRVVTIVEVAHLIGFPVAYALFAFVYQHLAKLANPLHFFVFQANGIADYYHIRKCHEQGTKHWIEKTQRSNWNGHHIIGEGPK